MRTSDLQLVGQNHTGKALLVDGIGTKLNSGHLLVWERCSVVWGVPASTGIG